MDTIIDFIGSFFIISLILIDIYMNSYEPIPKYFYFKYIDKNIISLLIS